MISNIKDTIYHDQLCYTSIGKLC